jgi:hypothetical protein
MEQGTYEAAKALCDEANKLAISMEWEKDKKILDRKFVRHMSKLEEHMSKLNDEIFRISKRLTES